MSLNHLLTLVAIMVLGWLVLAGVIWWVTR
jgi:hypothetical protein